MSISLYNTTNQACSRLITKRYSTSFSLGIRMLGAHLRGPVYAIYGFVRFADEIVDTFHGFDKETLFEEFKEDTWKALIGESVPIQCCMPFKKPCTNTPLIAP